MAKLLNVLEMAELLHVSKWTVYSLAKQNKIPAVRLLRGKLLFDAAMVQRAVEQSQKTGPETPAAA